MEDTPGSVGVIEEVNLGSPGEVRAETFLRHFGKASRMLGSGKSLEALRTEFLDLTACSTKALAHVEMNGYHTPGTILMARERW